MGFLKDLDDTLGAVTAPLGGIGRTVKKVTHKIMDELCITQDCGICGQSYSNKFEECPYCKVEKEKNEK